ncbi:hypothetical protein V8E55_008204 [Tylopilus felleus]
MSNHSVDTGQQTNYIDNESCTCVPGASPMDDFGLAPQPNQSCPSTLPSKRQGEHLSACSRSHLDVSAITSSTPYPHAFPTPSSVEALRRPEHEWLISSTIAPTLRFCSHPSHILTCLVATRSFEGAGWLHAPSCQRRFRVRSPGFLLCSAFLHQFKRTQASPCASNFPLSTTVEEVVLGGWERCLCCDFVLGLEHEELGQLGQSPPPPERLSPRLGSSSLRRMLQDHIAAIRIRDGGNQVNMQGRMHPTKKQDHKEVLDVDLIGSAFTVQGKARLGEFTSNNFGASCTSTQVGRVDSSSRKICPLTATCTSRMTMRRRTIQSKCIPPSMAIYQNRVRLQMI